MAILRVSEIRRMSPEERKKKLEELKAELARARALAASGAPLDNPKMIRELRKAIARILTIQREEELGLRRAKK
ncbi:MAG: 50S ribosomal protein L29 [Candidatus Methanomethylicota archaeon]|uniref:Large ribosomal subunit protein uL29 n=1 Tax=Thermoproteota archaeon TaxID=2056631 RepID=A0A497F5U1_9CREN|nr:MAG: 50S ribosomal protein L29 [Candidatus Verstraetearchaeota archaeon]RLE55033.1 MAG: 50S ribosomal protein L29 [Candidatus Verstraetearchaeota archaeon]